jgi:hypothetical protein
MSAIGRKRKSESRFVSEFDVRFVPGSGPWNGKVLRGRCRPKPVNRNIRHQFGMLFCTLAHELSLGCSGSLEVLTGR